MKQQITRRAILSGLFSGAASIAYAGAPLLSLRPTSRPVAATLQPEPIPQTTPNIRATLDELIAAADLGEVSCVITDAREGTLIADSGTHSALPPASVTKALTALYALNILGGAHRFVTRLYTTGPIIDDRIEGNLILAGGADPTLSADDLASLAAALKETGITGISGQFLCWRGAIPYAEEIEPSQLDHLGYNPALSGLNLNYNRVHFEWKRVGGTWQTTMDARTETLIPPVTMATMRIANREAPVFETNAPDQWSVARGALGNGGSRWLPVRQPALYAGDVFRAVASDIDLSIPEPQVIDDLPQGLTEVAQHTSPTLRSILNEMLLYSTNLTAEICGVVASQKREQRSIGIEESARLMSEWLNTQYGIEGQFKDHSGLSDENRISAAEMVKVLLQEGPDSPLRPIMRRIPMRDINNNRLDAYPTIVRAKTGTLNFVSTLAGYIQTAQGRDLAFAIFAADLGARERGKVAGEEIPPGSIAYNQRAKRLQQVILQRWGLTNLPDNPILPEG